MNETTQEKWATQFSLAKIIQRHCFILYLDFKMLIISLRTMFL